MERLSTCARSSLALAVLAGFAACSAATTTGNIDRRVQCLALSFGPWSSGPDYELPLPAVVELNPSQDHPWRQWMQDDTATHVAQGWARDGTPSTAFDIWRQRGEDSVVVSPFLRPAGYRLVIERGDGTVTGVVTFHTDAWWPEKPPDPQATVTARPTPCPPPSKPG